MSVKFTFLPKTKLGKWAVSLMLAGWVFFIVGSVLPWQPGYSGMEFFVQNPLQGIISLLLLAAGIGSFLTAINSVTRDKERSLLVFLAILAAIYSIPSFVGSLLNLFFYQG